ncbi:MAG: thioredoxin domain-containing protein [Schlesneria sp.]
MQDRVSLGGRTTASLWTMLLGLVLVTTACSWVTITSVSAQATDQNNILLDFSAKWCVPCQKMSPIVSKLERQGYPIRQVDIDQEQALAQKYGVESIPCFVLIANGREINRITGATDERQLKSLMMTLPKQNIDDSLVGKSSRNNGQANPEFKPFSNKASDEKKSLPKLQSLFGSKNKSPKQLPVDESETFRGQDPDRRTRSDEVSRKALAASTRIRVKDGSHVHFGSGTVIESQSARAVILTCGHILRDLGKGAVIEVDLFSEENSKPMTVVAQIMQFDLDADVGLLSIPGQPRLDVVSLAIARDLPEVNDRVFSIGCGGGKLPSVEEHVVTAINGCVGPENLECTGIPQQGRSGGGLFLGAEQVGVCILADPNYKRGIYTGMKPVAQLLRKANLGHLAPSSPETNVAVVDAGPDQNGTKLGNPVGMKQSLSSISNEMAEVMTGEAILNSGTDGSSPLPGSQDFTGAEIVVIVRPKGPGASSRVVVINQASARLVDDLLHESSGAAKGYATTTASYGQSKKTIENRQNSFARKTMQKSVETGKPTRRPIETLFEADGNRNARE